MWTQKFCLICIYILRNYAFQISNEALFLAFLQPVANRLKSFILPSNRMGKTSSASTFNYYGCRGSYIFEHIHAFDISLIENFLAKILFFWKKCILRVTK